MIILGDALAILRTMDADSIDAIVTDPPAGISFMGKDWDHHKGGRDAWIAWMAQIAAECLRVSKPGAHALVWAIPRTSHWTATAWENGGWEVRDRIAHLFATGFPKSLNLEGGLGTALKPACEDWWLLRKPLSGTVGANMIKHGTGAVNVAACRIGTQKKVPGKMSEASNGVYAKPNVRHRQAGQDPTIGRWPANVVTDGSEEVLAGFPQSDGQAGAVTGDEPSTPGVNFQYAGARTASSPRGDTGSAARFFFVAKATRADREEGLDAFLPKQQDESRDPDAPGGNNPRNRGAGQRKNHHPTVKATSLMRWLVKLVTPPGGTVLDPFAGSGSTGKACVFERRGFVGIEQDAEYVAIARARIAWAAAHLEPEQLALLGEP